MSKPDSRWAAIRIQRHTKPKLELGTMSESVTLLLREQGCRVIDNASVLHSLRLLPSVHSPRLNDFPFEIVREAVQQHAVVRLCAVANAKPPSLGRIASLEWSPIDAASARGAPISGYKRRISSKWNKGEASSWSPADFPGQKLCLALQRLVAPAFHMESTHCEVLSLNEDDLSTPVPSQSSLG